jgi:hypothetical protein
MTGFFPATLLLHIMHFSALVNVSGILNIQIQVWFLLSGVSFRTVQQLGRKLSDQTQVS